MGTLRVRLCFFFLVASLVLGRVCSGADADRDRFTKVVFGCYTTDLKDFERFATRAKKSGATHINITAEDLPWGSWQYDTPGDPYPTWNISNVGLLKICPPPALQKYIPSDYGEKILTILENRCHLLRRLGLKAAFTTFEPQMLPEAVFTDHPLWRGSRVDHPHRSKVARFAPAVDDPQVRALYREAVSTLIRHCPEIDMLSLHTNDSGTGLDWSVGLYSGGNGNTLFESRPMYERLRDFFSALQKGARDSGGSLEIDMVWTREPDPARIVTNFTQGMAIENLEGPNATPYKDSVGYLLDYHNFYYPVMGIPRPILFLEDLEKARQSTAPRLEVGIGDRFNRDLYFRIYDEFWKTSIEDEVSRITFLKNIAAQEVGSNNAKALLSLWLHLRETEKTGGLLSCDTGSPAGCFIFLAGGVMARWITRPLVPFPGELKPEEKEYYRRFVFNAGSEEDVDNLTDVMPEYYYSGWGPHSLAEVVLNFVESHIEGALRLAQSMRDLPEENTARYAALSTRLKAFECLIRNARNTISYQGQLNRVRGLETKPERRPPSGAESTWDRTMMMETARSEIDNTAVLMQILKSSSETLINLAASREEEDIRILGPDLVEQLQRKINIMNAHWNDYKRIFTSPNL